MSDSDSEARIKELVNLESKDLTTAILLALALGPFGVMYASVIGGLLLIPFLLIFLYIFFSAGLNILGIFFAIAADIYVAYEATEKHNRIVKLRYGIDPDVQNGTVKKVEEKTVPSLEDACNMSEYIFDYKSYTASDWILLLSAVAVVVVVALI